MLVALDPRTEQAYLAWIKRYITYCDLRHPATLGDDDVVAFLTYLVDRHHVARSTQIQALSAIMLLYRDVLTDLLETFGPSSDRPALPTCRSY
jgi:hypothetical protein